MKVSLNQPLYQAAMPVMAVIESHGYEAYFVGGCVRDTLLNKPIHDIDIASSATPEEIEAIFPYTFDVGKQHGTIVVLHQKQNYEVTTFRTEGTYSDRRRPDDVTFVRSLAEDTLRRDFTINALAIDRHGELYDYHQGVADLTAKRIRAVGNAVERFDEDALRMMRAIRFASQLGFEIELQTFKAIQQLADTLAHVSIERIRIELSKFLQGDFLAENAKLLVETGLANYMLGLKRHDLSLVMERVAAYLAPLAKAGISRDERIAWMALLLGLGITERSAIINFLKRWKHSNQFGQDVAQLIAFDNAWWQHQIDEMLLYHTEADIVRLYQEFQQCYTMQRLNLVERQAILPIKERADLQINGQQLMQAFGWERGNALLGRLIQQLETEVVKGQLANQYPALLGRATELKEQSNGK